MSIRIGPAAGTSCSETPSDGTAVHAASDAKSSITCGSCAARGESSPATNSSCAQDARGFGILESALIRRPLAMSAGDASMLCAPGKGCLRGEIGVRIWPSRTAPKTARAVEERMLSQRRRTFVASLAWALVLMGAPTVAAFGQDPVIKPTPSAPGTGDRLPLPRNVRAVQHPDGRIVVTWSPISGATAYAITRSVPPDPAAPVTPNVTDTMFVDRQVTAGKTYYYVVSGVNDVATGLKAGASVKATNSFDVSGSHLTPTNVVARYDSATNRVILTWQGPSPATFLI